MMPAPDHGGTDTPNALPAPKPQIRVTRASDRTVFAEKDNADDGWIASDLTVTPEP
jgi:hypothetical protein